jgi:hypothetical protein
MDLGVGFLLVVQTTTLAAGAEDSRPGDEAGPRSSGGPMPIPRSGTEDGLAVR